MNEEINISTSEYSYWLIRQIASSHSHRNKLTGTILHSNNNNNNNTVELKINIVAALMGVVGSGIY